MENVSVEITDYIFKFPKFRSISSAPLRSENTNGNSGQIFVCSVSTSPNLCDLPSTTNGGLEKW